MTLPPVPPRGADLRLHPAPPLRGLAVAAVLMFLTAPSFSSELPRQAFSGGAVDASGGGLRLRCTLGEAGFVGRSAGPSHALGQGFWAQAFFSIASDAPEAPAADLSFANDLAPAFPNPFRRATTFVFGVARPSPVKLRLFDVAGRRVATLVDGELPAGRFEHAWSGLDDAGRPVASGVYFSRLEIGTWSSTRRVLKLR